MKKSFKVWTVLSVTMFLFSNVGEAFAETILNNGTKQTTTTEETITESSTIVDGSSEVSKESTTQESSVTMESTSTDESKEVEETTELTEEKMTLQYELHRKESGWQEYSEEDQVQETDNLSIVDGLKISLKQLKQKINGNIHYQTRLGAEDWQKQSSDGQATIASETGEAIEAIKVSLSGEISERYDVYYRVYAKEQGWLGWAKNNEEAGTNTSNGSIKNIQIKLFEKGQSPSDELGKAYIENTEPKLVYQAHLAGGWQGIKNEGEVTGTTGESRRMEAIRLDIKNTSLKGKIEYQTHVAGKGWLSKVNNWQLGGTAGESRRMEGIRINLTEELEQQYDIYYRSHVEGFGWLDWTKNGGFSGTGGFWYRMEAMQIKLVKKGQTAPGSMNRPSVNYTTPTVTYQAHMAGYGWGQAPKKNGAVAGTSGESRRIEGIRAKVSGAPVSGGIEYRAHVEKYGWLKYAQNWQLGGTDGQSLQMETVRIRLTGELSKHFDVYYRTHSAHFGWLGWASNNEAAGTGGYGYRMESLKIILVKKGFEAPAKSTSYKEAPTDIGNFHIGNVKRVQLTLGTSYYSDRSMSRIIGNIPPATIVNVSEVQLGTNGYPVLKTPYGYLKANKSVSRVTNEPEKIMMNVPYYNQNAYGYWNGCEEFSLYMALAYFGATRGQSVVQVTEAVPRVPSGGNPALGFNGDPKDSYGYHTIYPSAFTPYAQRYAPKSRNISGANIQQFKKELLKGKPIVVWGTYPYVAAPITNGYYYDAVKVMNLHVWLVTGFEDGSFHITDPIYGKFWSSEGQVAASYAPNKMAVVIDN